MDMLSMGGYGAYVWAAYALTAAVVVACVLQGRRRHRQVWRALSARYRAMEGTTGQAMGTTE